MFPACAWCAGPLDQEHVGTCTACGERIRGEGVEMPWNRVTVEPFLAFRQGRGVVVTRPASCRCRPITWYPFVLVR